MTDHEAYLASLRPLTADEEVYRGLYALRDDPKARKRYLKEHEAYARAHYLFIPDYPFITIPEYFSEESGIAHLRVRPESSADVVLHSRYTPVFCYRSSYFELLYVLEGHCAQQLDTTRYELRTGDLVFITPGTARTIEVFDESLVITVHLKRARFAEVFSDALRYDNPLGDFFMNCLYSRRPARNLIFPTGADAEIRDTILTMLSESRTGDAYSDRILNNLVPILFARLLRSHGQGAHIGRGEEGADPARLRILGYIRAHCADATLADTAARFGYSTAHCSRLIKEETGSSFVQFLRSVRLDQAMHYLRETTLSVSEIARIVGYENPESFIRVFEKVYHVSPARYRRELRAADT